jgi:poly(A) polymerase
MGCYDEENDVKRRAALDHLEKILAQWALTFPHVDTNTNTNTNMDMDTSNAGANTSNTSTTNVNQWQRPRVALVCFGSFRLGVHRPESDLDVLALSPPASTRADFFHTLVKLLQLDPAVSRVHPIPQAYTPVIKFMLHSFHIDLVYSRAANPQKLLAHQLQRVVSSSLWKVSGNIPIPSSMFGTATAQGSTTAATSTQAPQEPRIEYMIDDTDLVGQDEAGVRSLNGARVTQVLLEMVPNLENYRIVLRAVKEWAVTHGIYSNVLGFLGGVNWAILVAWVCLRQPAAGPARLLELFFRTFCSWKWPSPIQLSAIQETPPPGALHLPSWNPLTNPRDGLHIMPIITPSYPSMNSSYNVGIPQLRRIHDEMVRACNSLSSSSSSSNENQGADSHSHSKYQVLFRQSDFFRQHKHFLQVTIRATNAQDFVEWFRLCESRLRMLISDLETREVNVWAFGRFFDRSYSPAGTATGAGKSEASCLQESCFFMALRFAPHVDHVNLGYLTHNYLHAVNSWDERCSGMDLSIAHVTSDKLPEYCWQADTTGNPNHDGAEDWSLGCGGPSSSGAVAPPQPAMCGVENNPNHNQLHSATGGGGSFDLASPTKRSRPNESTV